MQVWVQNYIGNIYTFPSILLQVQTALKNKFIIKKKKATDKIWFKSHSLFTSQQVHGNTKMLKIQFLPSTLHAFIHSPYLYSISSMCFKWMRQLYKPVNYPTM